jgi:putative methionine-R-sulfoxide reductase with GAF domain
MICVPVCVNRRVVGVLCVDSSQTKAFNEWEKDITEHFAGKIGLLYASLPNPGLWE